MKYLFNYLVDSFSLFDNVIYDYLVMGCIGIISYHVAYSLVGRLYRNNSINSRGAGHILHWTIRFVVFVSIFYMAATIIRIYKWVSQIPNYKWWIWVCGIGVFVSAFAIYLIWQRRKRNW
ncbi:MAG: hypothetical protein J6C99_00940 [Lachnospiraceae bacterium]|nr:hypothetical protein [Lachnospiraceae bacterium]